MLEGKKIILAVTGSIAAYKAAELCRFLVKNKARLTVLMTESAQRFIGSATFAGLTGKQPVVDLFDKDFSHIAAGKDADLFVIAPATANTIARLTAGLADDVVTTTALAYDGPILICPAMNNNMWSSKVTQQNIKSALALGYEFVGPARGDLACGDAGWGRFEDLDRIKSAILNRVRQAEQLKGKNILVTAGPTREYLDPVRFLSNPSSGKTGYAIAEEAARRGGKTILISGPTHLTASRFIKMVAIKSALDMNKETLRYFDDVDAVVMAAAVSDHRFSRTESEKIIKDDLPDQIDLERNPDVLANLGRIKKKQVLIGFAAETGDLVRSARVKLAAKNLDLIVATKVGDGQGFGTADIEAVIVGSDDQEELGTISKQSLAVAVTDRLISLINN